MRFTLCFHPVPTPLAPAPAFCTPTCPRTVDETGWVRAGLGAGESEVQPKGAGAGDPFYPGRSRGGSRGPCTLRDSPPTPLLTHYSPRMGARTCGCRRGRPEPRVGDGRRPPPLLPSPAPAPGSVQAGRDRGGGRRLGRGAAEDPSHQAQTRPAGPAASAPEARLCRGGWFPTLREPRPSCSGPRPGPRGWGRGGGAGSGGRGGRGRAWTRRRLLPAHAGAVPGAAFGSSPPLRLGPLPRGPFRPPARLGSRVTPGLPPSRSFSTLGGR